MDAGRKRPAKKSPGAVKGCAKTPRYPLMCIKIDFGLSSNSTF